jgi:murein DD-endopeptidase MepM/ murein hydrolase activator NlpD
MRQLSGILFLIGTVFFCNAQYTRAGLRKLYRGKPNADSGFIYQLPYQPGKNSWIAQGYLGRFSHQNRLALDFKIKKGDTIYAARNGVVIRAKEDGKKGGMNKKYRTEGNNIVIQHTDNSRAGYWHLLYNGALVQVGDSVKTGQAIGLCGKTGYATAPHLHFLVWKNGRNNWQQVPVAFYTTKGIRYLRPWRWYKRKGIP